MELTPDRQDEDRLGGDGHGRLVPHPNLSPYRWPCPRTTARMCTVPARIASHDRTSGRRVDRHYSHLRSSVCRRERETLMTEESTSETMPTFAELGLHPEVLRAVESLGYESPSPIQAATIPALVDGRDVIGLAQTVRARLRRSRCPSSPTSPRRVGPRTDRSPSCSPPPVSSRSRSPRRSPRMRRTSTTSPYCDLRRSVLRSAAGRPQARRAGRRRHPGSCHRPPQARVAQVAEPPAPRPRRGR